MKQHIVIHGPHGSGKTHIALIMGSLYKHANKFRPVKALRVTAVEGPSGDFLKMKLLIIDDCQNQEDILHIRKSLIDFGFKGNAIYITQSNISKLSEKDFQFIETSI